MMGLERTLSRARPGPKPLRLQAERDVAALVENARRGDGELKGAAWASPAPQWRPRSRLRTPVSGQAPKQNARPGAS
jgi:hypothetical protein